MLAGCMEALQSGPGSVAYPPAALPSTTATAVVPPTMDNSSVGPTEIAATAEPAIETSTPTEQVALIATDTPTPASTDTAIVEPATPTPEATFALPTPAEVTNEERWRAQELNRTLIDPPQAFTTSSSELWWYDPVNQQHVILGTFSGDFIAQARFILRGQGVEALEVPYQVNHSYGLTALSPAIVARIIAAGNAEWIETYVFVTPNISSR